MTVIKLGRTGKLVKGDDMFVLGKRKCRVGTWYSKEHVYVCIERGARKVRRHVVADKSADALSDFDAYLLLDTIMSVDVGTENIHFKDVNDVTHLNEISGQIYVDQVDPRKKTQTVKLLYSRVKMRRSFSRGQHRHDFQAVIELEDFQPNRWNTSRHIQ